MNAFLVNAEHKICLRPVEESDAELCAQWINSPELRILTRNWIPMSITREKGWIQRIHTQSLPPQDVVLVIMREEKPIGMVGLHGIQWDWRFATLGIFIGNTSTRKQGIGSVSYRLLLDYAFGEMGLLTLEAEVYGTNVLSQQFHDRMGFKNVGCSDPKVLIQGELVPVITYSMTKERWRNIDRSK